MFLHWKKRRKFNIITKVVTKTKLANQRCISLYMRTINIQRVDGLWITRKSNNLSPFGFLPVNIHPNNFTKQGWQYGLSFCSLNVPLLSCFRQKAHTKCSGWNFLNIAVMQRPVIGFWQLKNRNNEANYYSTYFPFIQDKSYKETMRLL